MSGLAAAEFERLSILIEEMGEALQVAGKILRHGWEPTEAGVRYDNRADLQRELGDVRAAMIRLCDAGDLNKFEIHARADEKLSPGGTILRRQ
jgi:NTP pyrophosphatase (non-canonical NTP hydrolase)